MRLRLGIVLGRIWRRIWHPDPMSLEGRLRQSFSDFFHDFYYTIVEVTEQVTFAQILGALFITAFVMALHLILWGLLSGVLGLGLKLLWNQVLMVHFPYHFHTMLTLEQGWIAGFFLNLVLFRNVNITIRTNQQD